jgi:hypothetical protein
MVLSSKFAALLAATANASNLRIGVISDIHLNPYYDATASVDENCWSTATSKESDVWPLARYGCDPSPELV